MNFEKLKLDKFQTYNQINFDKALDIPLKKSEHPEVIFAFCSSIRDVMNAINYVQNHQKNKENRVFFVFKKGQKDFNRDHLYNVVIRNPKFKRKTPILASLSKEYSVFSFMYQI
jgi:hypothetical protein